MENKIANKELYEALGEIKFGKEAGVEEVEAEFVRYIEPCGKIEFLDILNTAWR